MPPIHPLKQEEPARGATRPEVQRLWSRSSHLATQAHCVGVLFSSPPQGLCTGPDPHLKCFLSGSWKANSSLTSQLKHDSQERTSPSEAAPTLHPHRSIPAPCSAIFLAFITTRNDLVCVFVLLLIFLCSLYLHDSGGIVYLDQHCLPSGEQNACTWQGH